MDAVEYVKTQWSTYGGQNSDAMKLLNLYFTSGTYVSGDKERGER